MDKHPKKIQWICRPPNAGSGSRTGCPEASMTNFVTPYLPKSGLEELKGWVKAGKPAFHRCIQQPAEWLAPGSAASKCRNCAGVGQLFVSLCLLPARQSPFSGRKKGTYFEGNQKFYKGWYEIYSTVEYDCPHCQGTGTSPRQQKG